MELNWENICGVRTSSHVKSEPVTSGATIWQWLLPAYLQQWPGLLCWFWGVKIVVKAWCPCMLHLESVRKLTPWGTNLWSMGYESQWINFPLLPLTNCNNRQLYIGPLWRQQWMKEQSHVLAVDMASSAMHCMVSPPVLAFFSLSLTPDGWWHFLITQYHTSPCSRFCYLSNQAKNIWNTYSHKNTLGTVLDESIEYILICTLGK